MNAEKIKEILATWRADIMHKRDDLRSADLRSANLSYADLSSADLRSANLSYADLSSADLSSANLSYADLSSANLRYADLSSANLRSADLRSADLSYADLSSVDLSYADLHSANLSSVDLPTGEPFEVYLSHVVPALLTAGGRTMEEILATGCWCCHTWENCPTYAAFGAHNLREVPVLHRPRAEQFIQLFDAGLIPKPDITPIETPNA